MKDKYLGKWSMGDEYKEEGKIGKLILEDNRIIVELEERINSLGCSVFSSKVEEYYIKIYGKEYSNIIIANRLLAGKYSEINNVDMRNITNVSEVVYKIDNLADWLNIRSVEIYPDSACYSDIDKIEIYSDEEKKIEIIYNSIHPIYEGIALRPYYAYLEKVPYIRIKYKNTVDIKGVDADIKIITRFFATLIGRIDDVNDINIKIDGQNSYLHYCNTFDHSVFLNDSFYKREYRISYQDLKFDLKFYFEKWIEFYSSDNIIIDHFFHILDRSNLLLTDEFLTWCRIIDGYYIHENDEDKKGSNLKEKIKEMLKTNSEVSNKLRECFEEVGATYKKNNVASWIQSGYLQRVSFGDKVKKVCKANFSLIDKNTDRNKVYSMINSTRNYYAHFKKDNKDCLDIIDIYKLNELLFSTVVSIFLHKVGFEHDEVESILSRDEVISYNILK